MRAAFLLLLALAGCDRSKPRRDATDGSAGARLETAAIGAGLVIDPASRGIVGTWARDSDHACIVPRGGDAAIGLLVDYGQGQGCIATGMAYRRGPAALDLVLNGDCRIAARFEGERIVLPPEVPTACDRLCAGRASLAAMMLDRQSASVAEALSLRAPSGRRLCAG